MPEAPALRASAGLPAAKSPWQLARDGPVVRRALRFAVVVGPILIAINHGDSLLAGTFGATSWLKMGLTLLVPYLVSTLSSIAALRRASA